MDIGARLGFLDCKSFGGGPTKPPKNGFNATDPKPKYYRFQDQKMFSC